MNLRRKEQTVGAAVKNLIQHLGLEEKLRLMQVEDIWRKTMGENIAQHTLKIDSKQSTLMIFLDSPALRQELSFGRNKILSALHEELGAEIFTEVKFL
ncbi:MAG: DUF721 domain-containing protein [Flavobacteriaceae bacterium]|jgi:predicted nucleic acid-binding Zn ribbon protein|nr:DUF721 domain-containing protein [Flavobacteriaceae bacterium]